MAYKVSDLQARFLRLSAQRLLLNKTPPSSGGAQVVKDVVGIQAQEEAAAYLSIHSRSEKITMNRIDHELSKERSMIRSWFMRGTIHIIATEDLDWILPLLSPIFIQKNQRRYEELGLDRAAISRGVRVIEEALTSTGPMTRHDLVPYLERWGVNVDGQALIYLINRAAWEGMLCLGPKIGSKQSYVSLAGWINREKEYQPKRGAVLLAERYLAAYGPAGPKDFAAWSGLPLKMAREAWVDLGDRLIELEYPSGKGYILPEQAAGLERASLDTLGVHLLPKFDTFLLGYSERSLFVSAQHVNRINAGGGILRPTLWVNGRVQGIWRMTRASSGVKLELQPFRELSISELQILKDVIDGIAGFLEAEIELQMQRITA